ncbi:inner membrane protein YfcA [Pasteurella multocida subsp. septica]|nr:inner membrane protein YfcA [Pasteurella multocida subsp. septica]
MEIGINVFVLLFAVALVAGFIDAIAGGGGLITIPALLMTGMPLHWHWGPINYRLVVDHFLRAYIFCVKERSI